MRGRILCALVCAAIINLPIVAIVGAPEATAGGCVQNIAVGGTGDTRSAYVPGAPHSSHRIGYQANIWDPASRPNAERQIRSVATRAWARGCHVTLWAYSLGASAGSTVTDSWIRHGTRGSWNAVFTGNPRMPRHGNLIGIEAAGLPYIGYAYRGSHIRSSKIVNRCHNRDAVCSTPAPWHSNIPRAWDHLLGYAFQNQHRY
ncbi:hypothetical protein [Gordonia sp. (in: high G+C Gram-positive bacteria)]|uniref:hypothetical protein n=1 Tax=Gordonia sp. (in: high G+C Gram-positive bacteria) TaxID=84139 RepID=UPI003F9B9D47